VGGDAITFVRLIENLDYIDAVRFLAQRANMSMPEEESDGSAKKRQRLYEMNRVAGKFFHSQLFSEAGKAGMKYITGRGLSEHTIKRFGLGYAADDYHTLQMYMRSQGYSDYELADGALLTRNNNRMYDKFRDRLMFPIFDTRGNVVAFGGRALKDGTPAKYLNSDETLVFQKREMLFALNYAKNSKADYFILCEGYMDVISMHQAGFDSAVASLGTAITPAQARLISRMGKKEVILSYDADAAGQKAASRGINLFAEVGVKARVLKMDGAKDPDEFIKKFGAEAFRHLIESSGSAIDYEMDKLGAGLDLATEDGKSAYIKKAVGFLAGISNELDREVYITRAARVAEIPADTVRTAVKGEISRQKRRTERDMTRELIRPRNSDKINPDAYKLPREEKAERGIICCLYHNPDKLEKIKSRLSGHFATEFNGRIFDKLEKMIKDGFTPDISLFNEGFESGEMGRITSIVNDNIFAYDDGALNDYIEILNEYNSSSARKKASEMTNEELLELAKEIKEKKK
jgi:DNA primase